MRWMILALLIACGGSEKGVGVATTTPPGADAGSDLNGLFGGMGGSSSGGSGSVTLQDDAAVVHGGGGEAAVDAAEVDLDAAVGDGGVGDAGEDAAVDAEPLSSQCLPCTGGVCPAGYACGPNFGEGNFCYILVDKSLACPVGLRRPFDTDPYCSTIGTCADWVAMH